MQYWILKTEPETYSWDDLAAKPDGDVWDGIRNYQARNALNAMRKGDKVLIYHSGNSRSIVGEAVVSGEAFPDPADKQGKGWVCVRVKAAKRLHGPVTLQQIKNNPSFSNNGLVRQSRLSVIALDKSGYEEIIKMSRNRD